MTNWSEKVVVVTAVSTLTGGPDGVNPAAQAGHVGAICARGFAELGAQVIAVDSDAAALDRLAGEFEGGRIRTITADLLSEADLARANEAVLADDGRVDVLVTAHTDIERRSIEETSFDSFRRVVEFDLVGPVFAAKAFLPALKRSAAGAVVHLGSIDGTLGNPQFPSYSTAKGGIVPLTHVMAYEFGRYGIRVNCAARAMLAPRDHVASEAERRMHALTPMGRSAYPEDLVQLVTFLASEEASYLTGVVVPLDGGRSGITQGSIPAA